MSSLALTPVDSVKVTHPLTKPLTIVSLPESLLELESGDRRDVGVLLLAAAFAFLPAYIRGLVSIREV